MQAGTQLGHYAVLSHIGSGGMGSVWRARDTKLGREVAIKTPPEEFAKDADRLARFEREAKLLASLNHPNIAAIHGMEEDKGTHFLVLELVEGDTLADRNSRKLRRERRPSHCCRFDGQSLHRGGSPGEPGPEVRFQGNGARTRAVATRGLDRRLHRRFRTISSRTEQ